ncbi:MAG: sensor histidine kinase, partial [Actinomycetota bacterium]
MSSRSARWLAWSLFGLTLLIMLPAAILPLTAQPDAEDWLLTPVFVAGVGACATVGALVASRRPRNPIGWLFCAIGLLAALSGLGDEYVTRGLSNPGSLPGTTFLAWLLGWVYVPGLASVPMVFLLFPSGRVPTRRWRPVAWVIVGATFIAAVSFVLMPRDLARNYQGGQRPLLNPTGVDALGSLLDKTALVGGLTLLGGALLAVVALIVRFRKTRGEERQQVRWLAYVAATAAGMFVGSALSEWVGPYEGSPIGDAFFIGFVLSLFVGVPAASGVAILKYRLYDLDIVIKKTVVFAVLAGLVTLVYIGVVVGIGALVGSRGNTALTFAAAAIVAVAFQPARSRARHLADRLVYGKRATPYEVLSDFAGRMAGTYSTEDVVPRMARILGEGIGASEVRIWLRIASELVPAGSWPAVEPVPSLAVTAEDLPPFPDPARAFAVRHQGELLGAITVVMPPAEPLTPAHEKLIEDFGSQAGLVLRNVRLIEELRASRQRIVAAQDEERRRIERNIHDGAQQQLVALAMKLGLAGRFVDSDPNRAKATMDELQREAQETLENLRDLARGIYPPLLADQGLVAALEAQARKAPLRVDVEADGVGRYPQEAEAAVYFCALEALQNVAKYAGATRALVRLSAHHGELCFQVEDEGRGFDPRAAPRGAGLTNMADRLAALGGTL